LILNYFGDSVSGPEKAGVGGSIPSLATNLFNNLATVKNEQNFLARTIREHRYRHAPRTLVRHSPPSAAGCSRCADVPTWDSISAVNALLVGNGIKVYELSPAQESLEEAFLRLTKTVAAPRSK
jgi:hypothetical protein